MLKGAEIRCPHCHNLYGVMAATVGTIEVRCTRPQCKQIANGLFTVTVVSQPGAIQSLSDMIASWFRLCKIPVSHSGEMMVLTSGGSSTIIRR